MQRLRERLFHPGADLLPPDPAVKEQDKGDLKESKQKGEIYVEKKVPPSSEWTPSFLT